MEKVYEILNCSNCNQLSRYRCDQCGDQFCEQHSYHVTDVSKGYPITLCASCNKSRRKKRVRKYLLVLGGLIGIITLVILL